MPPFEPEYPARGHAFHFRCAAADNMRLDVMTVMRNVDPFETCCARRSILDLEHVGEVDVLGLEDLVACKKTRRDKDWAMVRRLVDVHYHNFSADPTEERVRFSLRELRTPETLADCVSRAPHLSREVAEIRVATDVAVQVAAGRSSTSEIAAALAEEQHEERSTLANVYTVVIPPKAGNHGRRIGRATRVRSCC